MTHHSEKASYFGACLIGLFVLGVTAYFAFAAVQGDFGHMRRVQINAAEAELQEQLAGLVAQTVQLENKTKRLSDDYLDLDLLDERARKVLGLSRGNEIIIR